MSSDVILDRVTKAYGEKTVFSALSHTFEGGGIHAVRAPSGAGKTTLLRLIAGLEKPDEGMVSVPVRISYLFQEPRLFPWLTAAENVRCVMRSPDSDVRAKELLAAVGLADSADLYPSDLSGGMRQRAALARALAYEADLYLLDEPFNGLDPAMRDRMAALILKKTSGRTMILVSHSEEEIAALRARVWDLPASN